MADLAAKTAVALLEYERLGRLTDKTRDDLTEALADVAGGRIVEVDDAEHQDDEQSSQTRRASSTSKGGSKS